MLHLPLTPGFMLPAFLFFLVRYLRAPRNKKPVHVLIKCGAQRL